jgi:hypothetical protein
MICLGQTNHSASVFEALSFRLTCSLANGGGFRQKMLSPAKRFHQHVSSESARKADFDRAAATWVAGHGRRAGTSPCGVPVCQHSRGGNRNLIQGFGKKCEVNFISL